jgi:hypothetical protein
MLYKTIMHNSSLPDTVLKFYFTTALKPISSVPESFMIVTYGTVCIVAKVIILSVMGDILCRQQYIGMG